MDRRINSGPSLPSRKQNNCHGFVKSGDVACLQRGPRTARTKRRRAASGGSQRELVFGIHIQNAYRSPANGRLANQVGSVPFEVVCPVVAPRMEQFRHLLGLRVDACQVRSLMQVAVYAGQSQVFEIVRAAVNLGNDVLDVKRRQRRVISVQHAILTTMASALPDAGSRPWAHRLGRGAHQLPCLPL